MLTPIRNGSGVRGRMVHFVNFPLERLDCCAVVSNLRSWHSILEHEADRAVLMLAQLHQLRSPDEMLASLAAAFRNVTEAAFLRVRMGVVPGGGDGFGADAALPLFILVVIRAKPQRLSSVCLYMERFTTRAQMLTEQGHILKMKLLSWLSEAVGLYGKRTERDGTADCCKASEHRKTPSCDKV